MMKVVDKHTIALVCEHSPRVHWLHFRPGEMENTFEGGITVSVTHIAICAACHALPTDQIKTRVLRQGEKAVTVEKRPSIEVYA